MCWENWKLHVSHRASGDAELYDFWQDPGECHNLAQQKRYILKGLTARFKAWTDTLPREYEHGDKKDY